MENFELAQQLKLELIQEYEKITPAIKALTGASLDDAREALHRAICRVLVGVTRRGLRNPVAAWRPYIIQTAVNELRKERNESKRVVLFGELREDELRRLFAIPHSQPTPLEHMIAKESRAILWAEVASLSPREGEVLKRWAHGSSFRDISKALGIKPSTARKLWSRGIGHLRYHPRVRQLAA